MSFMNDLIPKKFQKTRLKRPATFVCDGKQTLVSLIPVQEKFDEVTKQNHPVEGTGLRLRAKSFRITVEFKEVLEILMKHKAYTNGRVRIDDTDPTGFWRDTGLLKTKEVLVPSEVVSVHPDFKAIDFNKLSSSDEEEIAPLQKVS